MGPASDDSAKFPLPSTCGETPAVKTPLTTGSRGWQVRGAGGCRSGPHTDNRGRPCGKGARPRKILWAILLRFRAKMRGAANAVPSQAVRRRQSAFGLVGGVLRVCESSAQRMIVRLRKARGVLSIFIPASALACATRAPRLVAKLSQTKFRLARPDERVATQPTAAQRGASASAFTRAVRREILRLAARL